MNAKHFTDKEFNSKVTERLKTLSWENGCFAENWENFKKEVKQIAVERLSNLKFNTRTRERQLQKQLQVLYSTE